MSLENVTSVASTTTAAAAAAPIESASTDGGIWTAMRRDRSDDKAAPAAADCDAETTPAPPVPVPMEPSFAAAEGSEKFRPPCTSPVAASTPRRLAASAIEPAPTAAGCCPTSAPISRPRATDSAADETAAPTASCCARENEAGAALLLPLPLPLVALLALAFAFADDVLSASEAATHALPMRMMSVASTFEKGAVDAASADAATLDANAEPPIATAALISLPLRLPPALSLAEFEADAAVGEGAAIMALISAVDCVSVPTLTLLTAEADADAFDAPLPPLPIMSIVAAKSCVRILVSCSRAI
jgi:hypothetical protein